MKVTRTYAIDAEIVNMLKNEKNVSALINRLLIKYFESKQISNLTKEEIERELAILDIQKEAQEKIKALNGK